MAVHVISEKKYTLPEFKKKMENRLVGWELLTQKESRRLITLSVIYPRSITVYATNIESVARNCPVKAATYIIYRLQLWLGNYIMSYIMSCHILGPVSYMPYIIWQTNKHGVGRSTPINATVDAWWCTVVNHVLQSTKGVFPNYSELQTISLERLWQNKVISVQWITKQKAFMIVQKHPNQSQYYSIAINIVRFLITNIRIIISL